MPLSKYVDPLDGVAKSRYFDKLKVLGLAAADTSGAAVTSRMQDAIILVKFLSMIYRKNNSSENSYSKCMLVHKYHNTNMQLPYLCRCNYQKENIDGKFSHF